MNKWFANKNVIVTGASSGFGKLLAEKLVKIYGCKVLGTGRSREKLESLKNTLGDDFSFLAFDAGDENEWIKAAEYLENGDFKPDILINNAGILPPFKRFMKTAEGEAERVFKTNFFASVYSVRHVLPLIKAHSKTPTVINVSSSACLAEVAGTAAYSASKSALASFTKILALENEDVYVALVCPGFSDTAIFRSQKSADEKTTVLIKKFCSDPDKITDAMLKKIAKKRKKIVLGGDAKAMGFFGRLFPSLTNKAIRSVLEKSKLELFSDVFDR